MKKININLEEYAYYLGRLHSSLTTFEFALRGYLYAKGNPPHNSFPFDVSFTHLKIGDIVPENALTDYSTLTQLIDRYNALMKPVYPEAIVDISIVNLRDALAHGRIITNDPTKDLVLLKFSKPIKGSDSAIVTYSQELTIEWLDQQVEHIYAEIIKIQTAPDSPFDQPI